MDQTDGSHPALVVGTPPRGMTKAMAAKKEVDTPPRGRKKANNPHKLTMHHRKKGMCTITVAFLSFHGSEY